MKIFCHPEYDVAGQLGSCDDGDGAAHVAVFARDCVRGGNRKSAHNFPHIHPANTSRLY